MNTTCHHCGASFDRSLEQIRRAKYSFCSVACKRANPDFRTYAARQNGDKQRGRGAGKTYRKLNGRHEHRVVMERVLGRALVPGEIVHHKDGNKRNNVPANLEVMTQSEHARLHNPMMRALIKFPSRGSRSGRTHLTEPVAMVIRMCHRSGFESGRLAAQFNIVASTVQKISSGKSWAHV